MHNLNAREVVDHAWREMQEEGAPTDTLLSVAHQLARELIAAERLCEIYFAIAASHLGEEEVRTRRDGMIARLTETKK